MEEYPRMVAVETTNHCNAKCVFCPNNALARDKGPMAQDVFEKIIEDCREFPLEAIEPFIQGDPFSDPQILPRLEHIRRRLPKTKLRLYTNGYGMAPKKIDQMLDLGIDHLFVSVNTLDPDKYRSVMGIPLKRTLDNMEYLTDPSRKHRVANKITLCCMDQDGSYGWGDVKQHSVLELYRHATARKYRDFHASGRRREIEP